MDHRNNIVCARYGGIGLALMFVASPVYSPINLTSIFNHNTMQSAFKISNTNVYGVEQLITKMFLYEATPFGKVDRSTMDRG